MVRRPDDRKIRVKRAERHHDPHNDERLRHLPRNRDRDTADRRGERAVSTEPENNLPESVLPLIELVTELPTTIINLKPQRVNDPLRNHDMASNFR